MWISYALISALLLGVYDIFKKQSLVDNSVIMVLFSTAAVGTIIFIPVVVGSYYSPDIFINAEIYVPKISLETHLLLLLKAFIVLSSWYFAYMALKHLPLTIAVPIRATSPLWTLIGAVFILGEEISLIQVIGILVTISCFYYFSTIGKLENINFKRNIWVGAIILATLLGASSSLYDKFLSASTDKLAIQAWGTIYQVPLMLPFVAYWYKYQRKKNPFHWRFTVPMIAICLVLSDFFYFMSLAQPEALISVISPIRRSGVVVSFLFGALALKEKNWRKKGIALLGILIGVCILVFGSR